MKYGTPFYSWEQKLQITDVISKLIPYQTFYIFLVFIAKPIWLNLSFNQSKTKISEIFTLFYEL